MLDSPRHGWLRGSAGTFTRSPGVPNTQVLATSCGAGYECLTIITRTTDEPDKNSPNSRRSLRESLGHSHADTCQAIWHVRRWFGKGLPKAQHSCAASGILAAKGNRLQGHSPSIARGKGWRRASGHLRQGEAPPRIRGTDPPSPATGHKSHLKSPIPLH